MRGLLGLIVLPCRDRRLPRARAKSSAASRTRIPARRSGAPRRALTHRSAVLRRLPRRAARAGLHDGAATVPEPDRRKLQESLRTLDKYNGPIDGNL